MFYKCYLLKFQNMFLCFFICKLMFFTCMPKAKAVTRNVFRGDVFSHPFRPFPSPFLSFSRFFLEMGP